MVTGVVLKILVRLRLLLGFKMVRYQLGGRSSYAFPLQAEICGGKEIEEPCRL